MYRIEMLKHLQASKADDTLVMPEWHSGPLWSLLSLDGVNFRPELTDLLILDSYSGQHDYSCKIRCKFFIGDSIPK